MKKTLILLGALASIFFISCEDDPHVVYVNPDPDTEDSLSNGYMPMATGNTWVYENSYYHEDGEPVSDDPEFETHWDTVRVVERAEYEGRQAFRLETTSSNSGMIMEQWFAVSGEDIYFYRDAEEGAGETGDFPFEVPDIEVESKWMKVLSASDDNSILEEIEIPRFTLPFGGLDIEGEVMIKLKSEDNGNATFGDKSAQSRKATTKSEFEGTAYFSGFPLAIDMVGVDESVYMRGIGKISSRNSTEISQQLSTFLGEIYVMESVLIDFQGN